MLPELEAALDALLTTLEGRQAAGNLTLHDPLLSLASDHVDCAVAAGARQEHQLRLARLRGALVAQASVPMPLVIETKTPHLNGIVLPGERAILKAHDPYAAESPRDRRPAAESAMAPRGNGRPGRENRRFKRYSAPSLWVSVEGLHYRTLDWSIGGMALIGAKLALPAGREVKVTIAPEVRDLQPPAFTDRATVVRSDAETGRLFVQFRSTSSATLKVLEYLSRKRFRAVEVAHGEPSPDGSTVPAAAQRV